MFGFKIYILFLMSYFLHFSSRLEILGLIRIDLILRVIILLFMIGHAINASSIYKNNVILKGLLILFVYLIISIPFVEWPGSVVKFGLPDFLKVVCFFFFSYYLINNEKSLKIFIYTFMLCQLYRVIEPIYLNITTGYMGSYTSYYSQGSFLALNRLSGAPHDVINPNQLAWIIVTTIPFIYFLVWKAGKKLKYLSLALFSIMFYGLLLTASRSGFICLIITIFSIIHFEKKKIKNMVIAGSIILTIILFSISFLSPQLQDRYRSIYDPNSGSRKTWDARINSMTNSFAELSQRPVFGFGIGTSQESNFNISGSGQISHNLYMEILQEVGLIGLFLFGIYVYSIIKSLKLLKKGFKEQKENNIWTLNLVKAIQVWVIMNLIYSLSSYGFSSWEWYLFGGVTAVILKLHKIEDMKSI
jgi:O-antigen ligase